jgi:ribosomal protein S18 acetylase RimI-like enzyme
MRIEVFRPDDIAPFLGLAAGENWVADRWEFDFLLQAFPQGCFTARTGSGEPAGFVTSLRHGQSGWIGNLIVAEGHRGRGIGDALFTRARDALRGAGAETVWLTASGDGLALYRKHGFHSVDKVIRWVGKGRRRHRGAAPLQSVEPTPLLAGIDSRAWGDRRDALLVATVGRGRLLQVESGFAVIQECGAARQLGPFSAQDSATAEQLLNEALQAVDMDTKVYIDAPASNRDAVRLFNRRRLRISGSNELMYAGRKPAYVPERIYGLASMGSMG